MPSFKSRVLAGLLKRFKPIISNLSLELQRVGQDKFNERRKLPKNISLHPADIKDVRAEWFHPKNGPEDKAILFFHGGAYVMGTLASCRILAMDLAYETCLNVLSFEYRLAPEHVFPAALEDALKAYDFLIEQGIEPHNVAFVGDSAGGGLAIATALSLKAKGAGLPAVIVGISPWVDLLGSGGENPEADKDDPLINSMRLKEAAKQYAGDEPLDNPLISPLFGDFSGGFPSTLIHVGTREVLLDDSVRLKERMEAAGVDVSLEIWQDMWHVFQMFDTPESKEAIEAIGDYLNNKLGGGCPPIDI
ncbi:MAG: alpha/beta hydrolase [Christensenellales bacterium]|jgi:monoterpene epsilon-lactone hydrolase